MIKVKNLSVYYDGSLAVKDVTLEFYEQQVTAVIGPSGCGKSTLLRCLNRMNDIIVGCRVVGEIKVEGRDVYDPQLDVVELRAKVGMVFQKPNPFSKSIYENIAYGVRLHGLASDKTATEERVVASLRKANLFEEVKDRLKEPGTSLSGGQQQRLCIARALAIEPRVILFDEPTSSLDPGSTAQIEELMEELKRQCGIVLVTHNLKQAGRVADRVAFMHLGELVEVGTTDMMFTNPIHPLTQQYVTGRFG